MALRHALRLHFFIAIVRFALTAEAFPMSPDEAQATIENKNILRDNDDHPLHPIARETYRNNHTPESAEVISVSITSSVAVDRGVRNNTKTRGKKRNHIRHYSQISSTIKPESSKRVRYRTSASQKRPVTLSPPTSYKPTSNFDNFNASKDEQIVKLEKLIPIEQQGRSNTVNATEQNMETTTSKIVTKTSYESIESTSLEPPIIHMNTSEEVPIARSIPRSPFFNKLNVDLKNIEGSEFKNFSAPIKEAAAQSSVSVKLFSQPNDNEHWINTYQEEQRKNYYSESPSISYGSENINNAHLENKQEPVKMYEKSEKIYDESSKPYSAPAKNVAASAKEYSEPVRNSEESSKVYSEPVKDYEDPAKVYREPENMYGEPAKIYGEPAKEYSEPEKIYSDPAKSYEEPAKVYGEPEKLYSEIANSYEEPEKIYGEPEKIYSEPAKSYGEPAKVYSEPEKMYNEPVKIYGEPVKIFGEPEKIYGEPVKNYGEPSREYGEPEKIYSEPSKVYSEPAKIYSEPAKIYGEPSKFYSEPSKFYSQPAKIYSEPSKFYSHPASLYIDHNPPNREQKDKNLPTTNEYSVTFVHPLPQNTEPSHKIDENTSKPMSDHSPEQNYEVDEGISIMTNGRTHGIQETTTEHNKSGYVVEGKKYKKYRVEERTSDGFIVGEYGIVSNDNEQLRGVRYTADSSTNPRLIYNALLKFLSLQR